MAKSGTIYGTPASNGNYIYIEWAESEVSTSNNTSKVTATVKFYNPYGSYSDTSCPWSVTINGSTKESSISSFRASQTTVTLGSYSRTITHNSNGDKSITVSAYFNTQGTSTGAVSASGTAVLSNTGGGFTCTQSLKSKTATTITMNWSSDATIDYIWYSWNGGTDWTGKDITASKSGTYTISGLKANTTYKVITSVLKKGTSQWVNSSTLSVTTYAYPTVTQSLVSKTATSVTMKYSSNYIIDYIWYSWDDGVSWGEKDVSDATSGTYTITRMTPNKTYKIKTRVRAKSTQVTNTSSSLSVTTYNYPTVTQSVSSKTDTTVTMKYSSNYIIDHIWYSWDDGVSWGEKDVSDATSGTYTITRMTPNKTYKIKTKVRAKSTQVTNTTSSLSVTTYPSNYFTLTLTKKGSSTVSSFQVLATTSNTQDSSTAKNYSYKWTHYPSGKTSEAVTANSNNVASCNSSVTRTFSNLLPNTEYTVKATLYKGTVASGTLLFTKSITVKTTDVGGSFSSTVRTSSVITMALTGVAKLPYTTRVKFFYKSKKNTNWLLKKTFDIGANESKTISQMFTGLTQGTAYNFKAELYKVDGSKTTLLKTYTADASTTVYVPDADEVIPSITDTINVPYACKALIQVGATDALKPNTQLYLLVSDDGTVYTTNAIFNGDLTTPAWSTTPITGTVGTSKYVRAVIKDANGVEHNSTEPVEIQFKDLEWRTRVTGEAVDLEADNIRDWANAMLQLFEFDKTTGGQERMAMKNNFYNNLKGNIQFVSEGEPIFGGGYNAFRVMSILGQLYVTEQPTEPEISRHYPIKARVINGVIADARTALETII